MAQAQNQGPTTKNLTGSLNNVACDKDHFIPKYISKFSYIPLPTNGAKNNNIAAYFKNKMATIVTITLSGSANEGGGDQQSEEVILGPNGSLYISFLHSTESYDYKFIGLRASENTFVEYMIAVGVT